MPTIDERLRHVTLKIKRSKEHVDDLDRELRHFFESTPYKIGTKRDPETRKLIYYLTSVAPVPDSLPLIAGDAIQNSMTALDHLAYQIVCTDTGDPPPRPHGIYFPIADDAAQYAERKQRHLAGARQETINAFDALRPYKRGNNQLWSLYHLNNIQKHRLLITVWSTFQSPDLGAHMSGLMKKAFPDSHAPSFSVFIKSGAAASPLKAGDELFIDAPEAEVNENMRFRFNIALNEPGISEGEPLLDTLNRFSAEVETVVSALTPLLR